MDSLLASLDSVRVTFDEVDTYTKHPLFSLYKNNYRKGSQEARRSEYLKEQKKKRVDKLNEHRGLDFKTIAKNESFQKNAKQWQSSFNKDESQAAEYKNLLMMNEWLTDVPEDFAEWIAVPCPLQTRRVLIIANKGSTIGLSRRGRMVIPRFPSALPGGSKSHPNSTTLIDALWDGTTIKVIDAIQWGVLYLADFSVEFRFAWLYWKWAEVEDLEIRGRLNRHPLQLLEHFPCSELSKHTALPPALPLDGFIFYHRDSLYEQYGRSPLVTWLKPYMLPELLPDFVPKDQVDAYYLEKPPDQMETDSNKTEDKSHCNNKKGSASPKNAKNKKEKAHPKDLVSQNVLPSNNEETVESNNIEMSDTETTKENSDKNEALMES